LLIILKSPPTHGQLLTLIVADFLWRMVMLLSRVFQCYLPMMLNKFGQRLTTTLVFGVISTRKLLMTIRELLHSKLVHQSLVTIGRNGKDSPCHVGRWNYSNLIRNAW